MPSFLTRQREPDLWISVCVKSPQVILTCKQRLNLREYLMGAASSRNEQPWGPPFLPCPDLERSSVTQPEQCHFFLSLAHSHTTE